jgi:hypothetical protein
MRPDCILPANDPEHVAAGIVPKTLHTAEANRVNSRDRSFKSTRMLVRKIFNEYLWLANHGSIVFTNEWTTFIFETDSKRSKSENLFMRSHC